MIKTQLLKFSSRDLSGNLLYPNPILITYVYFAGVWIGVKWEEQRR